MALVRWNPARDLLDLEREFNRIFNRYNDKFGLQKELDEEFENAVWSPLTDIVENDNEYVMKMDIPGVKKEDVKISYSNGEIRISGERKHEEEKKDAKYHRVERTFGKYYRSFLLPDHIKEDKIEAEFKDGQLTITVPKADEVKPKEIAVKVK
jgi:HSP20 family protein